MRDGVEYFFSICLVYVYFRGGFYEFSFINYILIFCEVIDYIWYFINMLELVLLFVFLDKQVFMWIFGFLYYYFLFDYI